MLSARVSNLRQTRIQTYPGLVARAFLILPFEGGIRCATNSDQPRIGRGRRRNRSTSLIRSSEIYSTENQAEAIREYARARGIEVVRTYADSAKSGLKIQGRDALRKLIDDVQAGATDFTMVLVYDVSRLGRFQDADESATTNTFAGGPGSRSSIAPSNLKMTAVPFPLSSRALSGPWRGSIAEATTLLSSLNPISGKEIIDLSECHLKFSRRPGDCLFLGSSNVQHPIEFAGGPARLQPVFLGRERAAFTILKWVRHAQPHRNR